MWFYNLLIADVEYKSCSRDHDFRRMKRNGHLLPTGKSTGNLSASAACTRWDSYDLCFDRATQNKRLQLLKEHIWWPREIFFGRGVPGRLWLPYRLKQVLEDEGPCEKLVKSKYEAQTNRNAIRKGCKVVSCFYVQCCSILWYPVQFIFIFSAQSRSLCQASINAGGLFCQSNGAIRSKIQSMPICR